MIVGAVIALCSIAYLANATVCIRRHMRASQLEQFAAGVRAATATLRQRGFVPTSASTARPATVEWRHPDGSVAVVTEERP